MKNVIRAGGAGICLLLSVGFAHAAETAMRVPTHPPARGRREIRGYASGNAAVA